MSPIEVVGVAASAVTVLGGVVGLVRHLRRRPTEDEAQLVERPSMVRRLLRKRQPRDIELVPLSFVISLRQRFPWLPSTLQAINYLGKAVELEHVTVEFFHVNMAPPIETVRGREVGHGILSERLSAAAVRPLASPDPSCGCPTFLQGTPSFSPTTERTCSVQSEPEHLRPI